MLRTLFALVPLALLTALGGAASAQTVWTIDPTPATNPDFTNVQAAVDAASEGDVLVFRQDAVYDSFVLNGKGLTLIADQEASVRIRGASIRNLAPGQRVALARLAFEDGTEAGLAIKNSLGSVWIQDCTMRGADGYGFQTAWPNVHEAGHPGLELVNAGNIAVTHAIMEGGAGESYALGWSPGEGGAGLYARGATTVAVHSSALYGGAGGNIDDDDTAWSGLKGGSGVLMSGADVQLLDCLLVGGQGGIGGEDFDLFFGYSCGAGGPGGDGVQEPFGSPGGTLRYANTSFVPGPGGPAYSGASCPSGPSGVDFALLGATITTLAADSYDAAFTYPHVEGQPISMLLEGPATAIGFLAVGVGPVQQDLFGFEGVLLIDVSSYTLFSIGSFPTTLQLTAPGVATVGGAKTFYAQLGGYDFTSGALTLSRPIFEVVFDTAAL